MPYDEFYSVNKKDAAQLPDTAFLNVSKIIREEAIHAFYGVNTVRIGSTSSVDVPNLFHQRSHAAHPLKKFHKFRRATIYFDQFNVDRAGAYRRLLYEHVSTHFPNQPDYIRTKSAHKVNGDAMRSTWFSKRAFLKQLKELSILVLDVDKLACLNGCHRYEPLEEVLNTFDECLRFLSKNGCQITIRGLHKESESS